MSDPGLAQFAALLLRRPAPDAGLLIGRQRKLETGLARLALHTNRLGRFNLLNRGPGAADRKEQVRVGAAAGCLIAPVVHVPLDTAAPSEGHATTTFRGDCEIYHVRCNTKNVCSSQAATA